MFKGKIPLFLWPFSYVTNYRRVDIQNCVDELPSCIFCSILIFFAEDTIFLAEIPIFIMLKYDFTKGQIPYAPSMVYLPTLRWFLGQMLTNYIEHMGISTSPGQIPILHGSSPNSNFVQKAQATAERSWYGPFRNRLIGGTISKT